MHLRRRRGNSGSRLNQTPDDIVDAQAAIKSGDKTFLPYVVLAQAYTVNGNKAKAQSAIQKVQEIQPDLAKRIEASKGGWRKAVDVLTPVDLRLPLM